MNRFLKMGFIIAIIYPNILLCSQYGIMGVYSPKVGIFGVNMSSSWNNGFGIVSEFRGFLSNPENQQNGDTYSAVSVGISRQINNQISISMSPVIYWRLYEDERAGVGMIETDAAKYDLSVGIIVSNHKNPFNRLIYQVEWNILRLGLTFGVGLQFDSIFKVFS